MSSRCLHNMVNFGPLTADIGSGVRGTPANFNGFRVLAALLHGSQVSERKPNFAALNRWRHLCSAGRPSRWAFAHILVHKKLRTRYITDQKFILILKRPEHLGYPEFVRLTRAIRYTIPLLQLLAVGLNSYEFILACLFILECCW